MNDLIARPAGLPRRTQGQTPGMLLLTTALPRGRARPDRGRYPRRRRSSLCFFVLMLRGSGKSLDRRRSACSPSSSRSSTLRRLRSFAPGKFLDFIRLKPHQFALDVGWTYEYRVELAVSAPGFHPSTNRRNPAAFQSPSLS